MKTISKFFICLIILTITILSCPHIHNTTCGYDSTTDSGCTHEHEESCYEETDDKGLYPRACTGPECPEY